MWNCYRDTLAVIYSGLLWNRQIFRQDMYTDKNADEGQGTKNCTEIFILNMGKSFRKKITFLSSWTQIFESWNEVDVPCSWALLLMGNFKHPDVWWKAETELSTCSPEGSYKALMRTFWLRWWKIHWERCGLDVVLANKEGLVGDVKSGDNLCCSAHEMAEVRIQHRRSRAVKITDLDIRRPNFGLFKGLLGRTPLIRALEGSKKIH